MQTCFSQKNNVQPNNDSFATKVCNTNKFCKNKFQNEKNATKYFFQKKFRQTYFDFAETFFDVDQTNFEQTSFDFEKKHISISIKHISISKKHIDEENIFNIT